MPNQLIKAMQLVGSLMAVAAAGTALAWYVVLWPFDRSSRWS